MQKWFVCLFVTFLLFDTIIIVVSIFVPRLRISAKKVFIYFTSYYYIYCLLILLGTSGPFIIICWFCFPRLSISAKNIFTDFF